jgi:hypothetical protein
MKDELSTKIDMLIARGKNRFEIWQQLKDKENNVPLRHHLNNKALFKDKRSYRFLNIFLSLILLFVTISKILGIVLYAKGMYMLVLLIVPMVNMYILKEILFFKRTGYQFLFIVTVLSLIYQENRHFPEILFIVSMLIITAFLYVKLFPKKDLIPAPVNTPKGK